MRDKTKYKVNFHITEHCNYHCEYCFAHFGSTANLPVSDWKAIVDNCIKSGLVSEVNIAGGEPLIYPHLVELIDYIRGYGIPVSISTNGSLLTDEWLELNAPKLKTIGLSVDSVTTDTLLRTGCCCKSQVGVSAYLSKEKLLHIVETARKYNSDIKIKIDTVVTKYNKGERLDDFINLVQPERWKILKMSVFKGEGFDNSHIGVSDEEFTCYVDRQNVLSTDIVVERELKSAYLIVNARGYLVDNFADEYKDIADLTQTPFAEAFKGVAFNEKLYWSRYDNCMD